MAKPRTDGQQPNSSFRTRNGGQTTARPNGYNTSTFKTRNVREAMGPKENKGHDAITTRTGSNLTRRGG